MATIWLLRCCAAAFLCVAVGGEARIPDQGWTPGRRQIARIEQRIVLPAGTPGLSFYERRYAGIIEGGRRVVIGSLHRIAQGSGRAAVVPAALLPVAADAGCDMLTLRVDAAASSPAVAACSRRLRPPATPPPQSLHTR